ncbi:hypothetical protein LX16_2222 [Stackebrandtia albiflava]|uniref:DUF4440 domain-containing protein n=1 Tax=Stackebrandtia albiflava TaxID=406432 RepID=A0A562V0P7_9ACTN|nr:DUF4440 domain-containing protein [Stackebrandtia albiflava]TWJ11500.1 hypothetical protein LX16_2222 [Stackebrandtia albiflava]
MPSPSDELATLVRELHDDLATWLGTPAAPEVFARFAAAQHPDFTLVGPDGTVTDRESLLAELREARNAVPGMRIEISDLHEVARVPEMVVVRFLETHHRGEGGNHRRVTAVLVREPGGDWSWRTVHETAASR